LKFFCSSVIYDRVVDVDPIDTGLTLCLNADAGLT
jgi:hypothetical protein